MAELTAPPRADSPIERPGSAAASGHTRTFATITALFFFWGFITVMNDVLIPFLKESFELTYFQAGLVQFAFFGAFFVVSLMYFALSVASGDPINRIGYQRTIVGALVTCGVGCALFYPAASSASYGFFLTALFVLATGVTLLQIAANPYAAILGKPENASSRLNLAQGFNSLGTTLAPIAGGLLLYKVFARGGEVTLDAIQTPYLIYGGMFVALAAVVAISKLPTLNTGASDSEDSDGALAHPQLRLGMAAIFLYVGAEVAIGSYLVNFIADPAVMGWPEAVASVYLAYYWGGAMIGRLCGAVALRAGMDRSKKAIAMAAIAAGLIVLVYFVTALRFEEGSLTMQLAPPTTVAPFPGLVLACLAVFAVGRGDPARTLLLFSVCLIVLLATAALGRGEVAMWAALGAGLFNSIMWSNIFTLSIDGLGDDTSQGSSLLVMMIVGGALFPLVMGAAADSVGLRMSFLVPILSYIYIAFFGWWNAQRAAGAEGV